MRTTRSNQGAGDNKDRKMSKRSSESSSTGAERRAPLSETRTGRPRSEEKRSFAGKPEKKPTVKSIQSRGGSSRLVSGRTAAAAAKPSYQKRSEPATPVAPPKEMDFLAGRNPIMEALRSGRPISKLFISGGDYQGSIREIIALAKEKGIPVQTTETAKLEAMSLGVRNQGVVAMVSPVAYSSVDEMVALAASRNEKPCIVLLDQLKDPQNLGAVLRTVDAAGAHGVLIPQRRSCQLSAAVAKASAGAIEYVKVAQIGNVAQTLEELKKQGFWVVGAAPETGVSYHDVDFTGPIVVVIGDEGEGMARLTRERCDSLVQIPMRGKVQSLNASVASAIILYEVIRQRSSAGVQN